VETRSPDGAHTAAREIPFTVLAVNPLTH